MLDLSPLDSWLSVTTWHTLHPKDEERFYKAIYRLMAINSPIPEPDQVEEYIVGKMSGTLSPEYLERTISQHIEKYEVVFSFIYENKIKL